MKAMQALGAILLVYLAAPAQAAAPACGETCLLDLATSYIDGLGAPACRWRRILPNGKTAF